MYNTTSSESTISCVFLSPSDASEKTCCVTYQLCDQFESGNKSTEVCNNDFPYRIELDASSHLGPMYCYTVTASNDTYIVKVEGNFIAGSDIIAI